MTLSLCMIVKNESNVILECLESVYKYIDYWVISDTGSDDGTPEIILDFFNKKNIKGELHHDVWQDFGHNRTLALQKCLGRTTYAFMMDADDILVGKLQLPDNEEEANGYFIEIKSKNLHFFRKHVFRLKDSWKYVGVLHEYPVCQAAIPIMPKLQNCYINDRRCGYRTTSKIHDKYQEDAVILYDALQKEPENTRYMFFV